MFTLLSQALHQHRREGVENAQSLVKEVTMEGFCLEIRTCTDLISYAYNVGRVLHNTHACNAYVYVYSILIRAICETIISVYLCTYIPHACKLRLMHKLIPCT